MTNKRGERSSGHNVQPHPGRKNDLRTAVLTLGALGVVYGDIGTNPLFAMREAFEGFDLGVTEANIIGLLSLIFWSLIIVITIKYLTFVMRADNDGEGGILALVALSPVMEAHTRRSPWMLLLGLFGAALLYGDGIITPAISVLAAVEGVVVTAPELEPFVVPTAVVILLALFLVQRRGTASLGRVFGPVMLVWFATIGVLGAAQIVRHPRVFRAFSPVQAFGFFADNGVAGFLVLGAVILVVVGGEALYADMGHFGRRPITIGWYLVVLPSLVLVYFGQGALLIETPESIDNPFFRLAPQWALYPLVGLAMMATVIASQALISGAYSITRQAVQLGFSPRVEVKHTSETQIGQIYVPAVNWLLTIGCIALVVGFRKSTNLAAAYGVAVSGTMLSTTILFFFVIRQRFKWRVWLAVPICFLFLVVDLSFFGATLFKIPEGGWLPLLLAVLVFTVLSTWHTGHRIVRQRRLRGGIPLAKFVESLSARRPVRAPGSGAYLFASPGVTPPALLASLSHQGSLHKEVLVISVVTEKRPRVAPTRRAEVIDLGSGFQQVILRFGFMEDPDVPKALAGHAATELNADLDALTYFVGRESLRVTDRQGMMKWREHLYALMSRNATDPAHHFRLPPQQVMELGVIVEL